MGQIKPIVAAMELAGPCVADPARQGSPFCFLPMRKVTFVMTHSLLVPFFPAFFTFSGLYNRPPLLGLLGHPVVQVEVLANSRIAKESQLRSFNSF